MMKIVEKINLENFTKRDKLILIIVLLVISTGLFYKLFMANKINIYKNLQRKLVSYENEIRNLQGQVSKAEKETSRLNEIRNNYRQLEKQLSLAYNKLPEDQKISLFLREIAEKGKQGQIDLISVDPLLVINEGEYSQLPLKIDIVCEYKELVNYLEKLENLSRLISVNHIRIRTDKSILPNCKIQLSASTYILN